MKIVYLKYLHTLILIYLGIKKFELRKDSLFFSDINVGDTILFKYKDIFQINCTVISINNFNTLDDVFDTIEYHHIVPLCISVDDAINKYSNYYPNITEFSFKLFGVKIVST
jgi:ASC-1-like (ASCH) protein